MALPIFHSLIPELSLMQTRWASELNPILTLPLNSGIILKSVSLASGTNSINHRLARKLRGWFIIRQRSAATVYDDQDNNKYQDKTLTLVASAAVVVDLYVF